MSIRRPLTRSGTNGYVAVLLAQLSSDRRDGTIEHWSPYGGVRILLRTVGSAVRRRGH